jgi:HD-GYP domain-containing protein (c-di-GMP phosphodiesterase class II)
MSSHRPYRASLGLTIALEEVRKGAGKIYDENVAAACLRLFEEKGLEIKR